MRRPYGEGSVSPRLERSCSHRAVYVNREINKKDNATIFHSPFKDGQRNKDYVNPSFVSSHLFYPQQYTQKGSPFIVKQNVVLTQADRQKDMLYRQRIATLTPRRQQQAIQNIQDKSSMRQRGLRHQRSASNLQNNRKNYDQALSRFQGTKQQGNSRKIRYQEPQQRLKKQLGILQSYRQMNYDKKIENTDKSARKHQERPVPVYLQMHRRDYQHEYRKKWNIQNELKGFIKQSNQNRSQKQDIQRKKVIQQNSKTDFLISQHKNYLNQQRLKKDRSARLLAGILKEQMKVKQAGRRNNSIYDY